jgi:Bacterial Ig-like domain/Calcineurin-like phosphoesterase
MKSMKLRVICVLVGMGLAMLLSVGVLGSEGSVSAQAFAADPVFVGAGDIASCARTGDEATAKLLDDIVAAAPSITTVFTIGDNAYESGTASEFANCYEPSWGRHKAITRPTLGNHEYYSPTNDASGYFGYFGAAAGDPSKGYYSYDLGEWHMVALNSMCEQVGGCDDTSPMVEWLKQDLATYPNTCTLAYFHHPLFSSGPLSGAGSKMKPSWEVLYAANADVVLSGHFHNYERFAPQTPEGVADPAQGIREFVVGTGGYSLNTFKSVQANSEVRYASSYGVLKLTLHPSSYDWQFVTAPGGTVADSGTASCDGGSEPPPPPPPPPDTTAPTVTGTIPNTDATGVVRTTPVMANFSEEMMASTINTQTFKLFKKGSTTKIAATVSYDANTDTATLDPTNSLNRRVTYKAVVTTGAQDLEGNPLDQDPTTTGSQQKAWFFTVS